MFDVQSKMCRSCIYRPDCPLDIERLEKQIEDGYGGFSGYRQCHHTNKEPACCAGFWARHKDRFQLGQIAQRLGLVRKVDRDEIGEI